MRLWRVSRHHDLTGKGGLHTSARWHTSGAPIVYLAESAPGALLEVCVHTSLEDVPPTYTLLEVAVEDSVSVESVDVASLPPNWMSRPDVTQTIGTGWLKTGRSALLRVPSALVPQTTNVLLNPLHPDARLARVVDVWEYPFDLRIKA